MLKRRRRNAQKTLQVKDWISLIHLQKAEWENLHRVCIKVAKENNMEILNLMAASIVFFFFFSNF